MEIQEPPSISVETGHPTLRAFRHRNFRIFFVGQSISLIGTWSQVLALSWIVWRMTGSPLWLGIVNFATQMPMILLGLPGGAAADRFDRLSALNLMQVLCMLQAIILAALTMTGAVELWHVLALAVALGVVYSFEFPLRQSFVMDMVGKRDLLNATALVSAMFHATRILGPTAAGAIVAWKGEGICFTFNAATFLFLIGALAIIDRRELIRPHHKPEPLWGAIKEGLSHMWERPDAKLALLIVAVVSGLGMQFTTLMPIFADEVFKGGAMHLGWLMGTGGLGSLAGALWLARRPTSEKLLSLTAGTATVFSVALIGFSITKSFYAALAALIVIGFFLTITFSGISALLQQAAPDHLRGRVMSIFTTAFIGFTPFGSLLAGWMAMRIGAPSTLTICGAACLVTGAAIWAKARSMDSGKAQ